MWRDSGQWGKLMTVWHDDAAMSTTWQQRSGTEFVAAARAGSAWGVDVQHMLGGTAIELSGTRAVAETKTVRIIHFVPHEDGARLTLFVHGQKA